MLAHVFARTLSLLILLGLTIAAPAQSLRPASPESVGLSAEISARIMEGAFYELDAPVARVCSREVPMPYAKHMEEAALPQMAAIVQAARQVLHHRV